MNEQDKGHPQKCPPWFANPYGKLADLLAGKNEYSNDPPKLTP